MHHTYEEQKGPTVTPTEQTAKSIFTPKIGRFATLGGLLHVKGSGALTGGRAGAPSLARLLVLAPALSAAFAAFVPTGALAAAPITFVSAGAELGEVENPSGIGINEETGDVYVGEYGNARVDRFEANGKFLESFGKTSETGVQPLWLAVDNSGDPSKGDVYVAGAFGHIVKFGPEGKELGEFGSGGPVAVDAVGDVWVGGDEVLQEYSSEGIEMEMIKLEAGTGGVEALAIDDSSDPLDLSQGDFYVKSSGIAGIQKLERSGVPVLGPYPLDASGNPTTFALDPTGDLFVGDQLQGVSGSGPATLLEFDSSGAQVEVFGAGQVVGQGLGHTYSKLGNDLASGQSGGASVLYVLSGEGPSDGQIFTPPPAGPLVTEGSLKAEPVHTVSATLNGKVNPEGKATKYSFEYLTEAAYKKNVEDNRAPFTGAAASPEGSLPAPGDFAEESVSATISGLAAETTYRFCLLGENSNGEGNATCSSKEDEGMFRTLPPALVEASVADIRSTSATLDAQVDPLGNATTCVFQYVTAAGFDASGYGGAVTVPCPAALGEGEVEVPVSVHVQDLAAGSVYHYRVVATNAFGTVPSADQAFTTQIAGVFTLLDGREWEMVSPPQKEGTLIVGQNEEEGGPVDEAADDGEAITYATTSPIAAGASGYANDAQALSLRTPHGWVTHNLDDPHEVAVGSKVNEGDEYKLFSEDLSLAVVQPEGPFLPCSSPETGAAQPCLSPAASEQTAFLHTDFLGSAEADDVCTDECFRPLVTGCPGKREPCPPAVEELADVPEGTIFGQPGACPEAQFFCGATIAGASPDGESVVVALSGSQVNGFLYEWNADRPVHEALQPVSVLPPTKPGGEGEFIKSELGFSGISGTNDESKDARGAISDDGSRVFWGSQYVRDLTKKETLRIGSSDSAEFDLATPNGSHVFYNEGGTLDECEIPLTGKLECADPTQLGQGQLIGASEDGSYVYFQSNELLDNSGVPVAGAIHGDCGENESGEPVGECNLYVRHDGVTGLVALLAGADQPDWSKKMERSTARVSPDGRYLAFMSQTEATGYDNHDASSGRPDEELYLYHAPVDLANESGALTCASCDPTGARPSGAYYNNRNEVPGFISGERVWNEKPQTWLAADVPAWVETGYLGGGRPRYQPRYLSDSGRLFFNAHDALVPKDIDDTWNVYEYEPEGPETPGCGPGAASGSVAFKPAHEFAAQDRKGEEGAGCVGLISSGESAEPSGFIDASQDGQDVFFETAAKLAPQDTDSAYDIYDAHECTALSPCIAPPAGAPPACTTVEGCRAAPEPQPSIYGAPSSATFSGVGNLAPASRGRESNPPRKKAAKRAVKCKRGFENRKGRCVRSKRHTGRAEKRNRRSK